MLSGGHRHILCVSWWPLQNKPAENSQSSPQQMPLLAVNARAAPTSARHGRGRQPHGGSSAMRNADASLIACAKFIVVPYLMLRNVYSDFQIVFWFLSWLTVQLPNREPMSCGRVAGHFAAYEASVRPEMQWIIRNIKRSCGRILGRLIFIFVMGRFMDWLYRNVLDSVLLSVQSYRARSSRPHQAHGKVG